MPAQEDNAQGGGSSGAGRHRTRRWLVRLFGADSKESATTQSYRRLALQLDFDLGKKKTGHSLMLTAPDSARVPREASIELAHFLAEELGHRVLLIDGSFGDSGISTHLGHGASPGLMDLLREGTGDFDTAVVRTGHERVFLLAAGRPESEGTISLKADDLKALLGTAREKFDYILVQSCPILKDSKCLVFPSLVDYVLLLAVEGRTLLDDLDASRKALADCKARKVGVVLTKPPRRWFMPR